MLMLSCPAPAAYTMLESGWLASWDMQVLVKIQPSSHEETCDDRACWQARRRCQTRDHGEEDDPQRDTSQANGVRTPSIHLNREPSSSSIDVPERESMDAVAAAAAPGRAYEDFVPPHSTVTEPATHTLSVDLSAAGYKKEHIRVQLVRSHGLLVVRGERRVAGNRWSRFRLEHRVPDGCDLTGIHAKFEDGVVRVTMPGLKSGPSAGRQEPAAAKADARDGGVAHEKAGDHAQGEGEKEDERVRKQQEEERASAAVKDGGRLDKGDGIVRGEEAVAVPSRGGYHFLIPERRKLATTVVGAVLVLFSLGLFVRYSLAP